MCAVAGGVCRLLRRYLAHQRSPPSPLMAALKSPRALYRSYLFHLRYLPDPHVWGTLAPRFKTLLREAAPAHNPDSSEPETSAAAAERARNEAHLRKIRKVCSTETFVRRAISLTLLKELAHLRMAVACHRAALLRLLEKCYGQRGRVKWELVKVTRPPHYPAPEL